MRSDPYQVGAPQTHQRQAVCHCSASARLPAGTLVAQHRRVPHEACQVTLGQTDDLTAAGPRCSGGQHTVASGHPMGASGACELFEMVILAGSCRRSRPPVVCWLRDNSTLSACGGGRLGHLPPLVTDCHPADSSGEVLWPDTSRGMQGQLQGQHLPLCTTLAIARGTQRRLSRRWSCSLMHQGPAAVSQACQGRQCCHLSWIAEGCAMSSQQHGLAWQSPQVSWVPRLTRSPTAGAQRRWLDGKPAARQETCPASSF